MTTPSERSYQREREREREGELSNLKPQRSSSGTGGTGGVASGAGSREREGGGSPQLSTPSRSSGSEREQQHGEVSGSGLEKKKLEEHGGRSSSGMMKGKECDQKPFVSACCPVSGHCIGETGIHVDTPQIVLRHGQRIYFCNVDCMDRFKSDVGKFLATVGDKFNETPSMLGFELPCPECKSCTKVTVTQQTPRLLLKYGQTIWFNSYSCLASFLKNPTSVMGPSGLMSMVLGEARASGLGALCPITNKRINLDERDTHFIEFTNGQRLYTCGPSCPNQIMRNPAHFIRSQHDAFVHPLQPALNGLIVKCVCCSHNLAVCEETTPRVQWKGGQSLFFHTNECVDQFLENPGKYVHSSAATSMTSHVSSSTPHTPYYDAGIVSKDIQKEKEKEKELRDQRERDAEPSMMEKIKEKIGVGSHQQQPQQSQQPQHQQPHTMTTTTTSEKAGDLPSKHAAAASTHAQQQQQPLGSSGRHKY